MNVNPPDPGPDPLASTPRSGETGAVPPEEATTRTAEVPAASRAWLITVLAGLLAGALAAGLGEQFHEFFSPDVRLVELQGNKMMQPTRETRLAATFKNGALDNAELGALMGLAMGLAGGLIRRSIGGAVVAALVGLVLGSLLGAVMPAVLFPIYYAARQYSATTEPDLLISLLMHGGIWACLGAAGGLSFALGLGPRGRLGRAVLGGLLGAFVAALLYEALCAVMFPLAGAGDPIPQSWEPRVFSRMLVPVLSALAVGLFTLEPAKSKT